MTFGDASIFGKITRVLSAPEEVTKVTTDAPVETRLAVSQAAKPRASNGHTAAPFSVGVAHLVLNALGELLDFLRLLDHVHGEDIGAGLIHVLLEFGGERHKFLGVKA